MNRTRAFFFGLFLVAGGCAHASAAVPAARPASAPARPAAAPPGAPSGPPSGALDPSEEITPQELASIPDPVPAGSDSARPSAAPSRAPAEAPEPRTPASEPPTPPTPPSAAPSGEWTWRVQILATPDGALAARVAAEASDRLGTSATIDLESGLSKVRLGGFATEGEAQILKGRAVEMGYPGAFRVKVRARGTDE
ncbi:MAG TPA: SPOR domain-containing protein [Candidatus Eisenbacteria bacterium]|nr:SPOR domain-containing protein [Candidatus Eisenbacteria bacterium]